jgi:hypothetical protein
MSTLEFVQDQPFPDKKKNTHRTSKKKINGNSRNFLFFIFLLKKIDPHIQIGGRIHEVIMIWNKSDAQMDLGRKNSLNQHHSAKVNYSKTHPLVAHGPHSSPFCLSSS